MSVTQSIPQDQDQQNQSGQNQASAIQPTPPLFIEDGWTIKGTIKEEPGHHQAISFHYRPMTWIERRKYSREQEQEKDEGKRDAIRAKHAVSRIIDWDQGTVSVDRINQLSPIVFTKLESILFGVADADVVEVERKN